MRVVDNTQSEKTSNQAGIPPTLTKLFPIVLMIAPFFYILILVLIDHRGIYHDLIPLVFDGSLTLVDFLAIIFALLTVQVILLTFAVYLPLARKGYDPRKPGEAFFKFFLALAMSEAIVIFGLILGILAWTYTGVIYWNAFWFFMAIGEGHLLYLYFFELPRTYRFAFGGEINPPDEEMTGSKEINRPLLVVMGIILFVFLLLIYRISVS